MNFRDAVLGAKTQQYVGIARLCNNAMRPRIQFIRRPLLFVALVPPTFTHLLTPKSLRSSRPSSQRLSPSTIFQLFQGEIAISGVWQIKVCTLRYKAALRCVATLGVKANKGTSILWRLIHKAVDPDSVARLNRLYTQVMRRKQSTISDRLIDTRKLP